MIDRQAVYNKYDGHCAYCGCELTLKDMQVDHMFPKHLKHYVEKQAYHSCCQLPHITDIDDIDNLMPSCRRCNHYKRGETLEIFRKLLKTLHERIQKQYIDKVAIDYGIITIHEWDGLFYFEKEGNLCK